MTAGQAAFVIPDQASQWSRTGGSANPYSARTLADRWCGRVTW